jgi:hypothetical protein
VTLVFSRYPIGVRTLLAAACLLAAAGGGNLFAQERPATRLAGRVLDQESGAPIEGAVVYIAGSSVGVSTPADGSFRITGLPPGTYDLTASRVGYDRWTSPVTLSDSASADVVIRLVPRAVQTGGVDVRADRKPDGAAAPEYFFPKPGMRQYCVFPSGRVRPIGVLFTDSAFAMYALGAEVRDSEVYVWLWLLYQNLSDHPHGFSPLRDISLSATTEDGRAYRNIDPLPPAAARELADAELAARGIEREIGDALAALRDVQARIRPGYLHTTGQAVDAAGGNTDDLGGVMIVRREEQHEAAWPGLSSEYLSAVFEKSRHAGILAGSTVAPDAGTDGVTYFPAPGLSGGDATAAALRSALRSRYEVTIWTPGGARTVVFHAN